MEENCPFLESDLHYGKPCCGIGLNFYSVGENRELCRGCPVPAMLQARYCRHLEFCTLLSVGKGHKQFVEAQLACGLKNWGLDSQAECQVCPHFVECDMTQVVSC